MIWPWDKKMPSERKDEWKTEELLAGSRPDRPRDPMKPTPRFIISACLCGHNCRYDGIELTLPRFLRLAATGLALPVCPEVMGGLGVPRQPCEVMSGRVFTSDGKDITDNFMRGTFEVLDLARKYKIKAAIFKDRSPSCGTTMIYDGSFKGRLIPGQGVATLILRQNGLTVFNEENAPDYFVSAGNPDEERRILREGTANRK